MCFLQKHIHRLLVTQGLKVGGLGFRIFLRVVAELTELNFERTGLGLQLLPTETNRGCSKTQNCT